MTAQNASPSNRADDEPDEPRDHVTVNSDAIQLAIGSQLRAVYDEMLRQPVPDRFLSLLSELDAVRSDPATPSTEHGERAANTPTAGNGAA